jgi:CRP/FNR family transcriptional regulator, anaerobic regulatory protein
MMNVNTTDILEQFGFYRNASERLRAIYADSAEGVGLPEGAMFYRDGGEMPGVALVGTGSIRVFKTGASGREITLYHVRAGETCLVNMMCVFLRHPAIASAQVETPTQAVILRPQAFRDGVREDDALRAFIFESMAFRMVDVMTLIEEVAFRRVDARLEELLLARFARQRTIDTTHEWIAAELGTAREVVSRLLKELERRGAIELGRGHIALRDRTKLGSAADAADASPVAP